MLVPITVLCRIVPAAVLSFTFTVIVMFPELPAGKLPMLHTLFVPESGAGVAETNVTSEGYVSVMITLVMSMVELFAYLIV